MIYVMSQNNENADGKIIEPKTYLMYRFPDDKDKIGSLSIDKKMEWYGHQFQLSPQEAAINLSTQEFEKFWKWRVLIPTKIKRFFYRVKNGEIFKRYPHITELKKEKGPTRI